MEVREPSARYLTAVQRTEQGEFPAAWVPIPLYDLATKIGSGKTPTGGSSRYRAYGRPFVRSQNVGWGALLLTDLQYIEEETHAEFLSSEIALGDVLLNITGASIGRSAVAAEAIVGGNVNQHVCIIRPRSVDPRLINHFLLSPLGQRQIESFQAGGNRQGLNFNQVGSIKIPLPSTDAEQRAIADALTDADSLIDSLEQLLTKKRQIKLGAMQELLTGKRRLPGFSGQWVDGVLGAVVTELVAGVSVNSEALEGGADVPSVVKTSAMKAGVFDPTECKPIIQADLARATTPLRKDTLLISRMNTPDLVGEVGYVDKDYDWLYLPDRIWMTRTRSPDSVCVRWLGYLLSSAPYKRRIGDTATGTSGSMKNIAKSALLGISVSFPAVDEQREIAAILADMDAEISALESRLIKARALKQAMAQALLTGRIRLVEPSA